MTGAPQQAQRQYFLRRDYLLLTAMGLFLFLALVTPASVTQYPRWVNWPTIGTLLGLMLLTKGLETSGCLHHLGEQIILRFSNTRSLGLFTVAACAILSMFLTNDIMLFVAVPLTLRLGDLAELPLRRLIIFEALAVNAGSMLTPIGNPQNILLWQLSRVHFMDFIQHMLPPFAIAGVCLLLLAYWAFPAQPIHLQENRPLPSIRTPLLAASLCLYVPFLVLVDMRHVMIAVMLVAAVFTLGFTRLLLKIDWALLAVFLLLFLDMGLLTQHAIPGTQRLSHAGVLYVAGAVGSQFISNVPAAMVLTRYSSDWSTIAWAVNIGGFGLVSSSLANLIALRLGRQPGSYAAFHAWSVPFFLLVATLTGMWLMLG
ncbi:MAG: anion transporter [Gammaproteobacteria bacterium]|nr:anion transporter [Gammaproteobacteria bacterium]